LVNQVVEAAFVSHDLRRWVDVKSI
jgi:hypothetical protein